MRGICEKPRIKCAECPHRRFLPVTDEVIRWHLSGRDDAGQTFVAAVYPMLLDDTCLFLAVDFDKSGWLDDSTAFVETCGRMGLSAALERSRSGHERACVAHLRRGRARHARAQARLPRLLQENGYLVLRYLAEDLAKELDSVLDGILRSLSARRKPGSMAIPITVVRGSRV